jgi:hypothetical protein
MGQMITNPAFEARFGSGTVSEETALMARKLKHYLFKVFRQRLHQILNKDGHDWIPEIYTGMPA